jgi:Zn-dependent peptidase ImmA (M78 family)
VSYLDPAKPDEPVSKTESFCNAVAAETLVPRSDFERAWSGLDVETLTARLSRRFWVSSLVILRRAYELELITGPVFFDHIERERKKIKKTRSLGGDYYRNISARMSGQFTKAVLAEARQGHLLYRDAARLLSMKVPTLVKFVEQTK